MKMKFIRLLEQELSNKNLQYHDFIKLLKDPKVLEGIELIEKELKNSLKSLNIEEIEAEGKHFDPKYHNVIAVINDNSLEDGVITTVYQAGYKINEKVLRYSQVIVNKIN